LKQRLSFGCLRTGLAAAVLAAMVGAQAQVPGAATAQNQAQMQVLVLIEAGAPPPSGLLLALKVQLGPGASVETRTVPAGLDPPALQQAAFAMLRAEQTRAALWIERTEPGARVQMVQGSADGPQLTSAEVRGIRGPDMDRTLALKISELLSAEPSAPSPAPPAPSPAPAAAPTPPPAPPPPTAEAPRLAWQLHGVAELAGVVSPRSDSGFGQVGPALAGGVSLDGQSQRFAALLDVTWLPSVRTRAQGGVELDVQELAPALRARAQLALGSVWLGANAGFVLALLNAEATTTRGDYGKVPEIAPAWLASVGVEVPMLTAFSLALDAGLQVQLRRQRFTVFGVELADSRRVRPRGRVDRGVRAHRRRT
jgi:hypothetical protein